MSRFAAATTVAPERTRAEIERTLSRYGATGFAYGWQDGKAIVAFEIPNPQRRVRFLLPLPSQEDVSRTQSGRRRHGEGARTKARDQETRRRWRALGLAIKAKLETVASGIAEFDTEFLAYLVLPGGMTVGERISAELPTMLTTGKMLPLLPGPKE